MRWTDNWSFTLLTLNSGLHWNFGCDHVIPYYTLNNLRELYWDHRCYNNKYVLCSRTQCHIFASALLFPLYSYTLEQQITPSLSMEQVNCNNVLVPSTVFTPPIVVPHNGFMTQQPPSMHINQHCLQPQQQFEVKQKLHQWTKTCFL